MLHFFLYSCQKPDSNLNVQLVGHAGSGLIHSDFQPNSLASIQNALSNGLDAVEVDLQITKDTVGLLCHDFIQYQDKYIHELEYPELLTMGLCKLESAIEIVQDYNAKIYIDIKSDAAIMDLEEEIIRLNALINQLDSVLSFEPGQVCVVSRNSYLLNKIENSKIFRIYESDDFQEQFAVAVQHGFDGVLLKESSYHVANVRACQNSGLVVGHLNTSSYQNLVRDFNLAPDFIILEDVSKALKLRRYGEE